MNITFCDKCGKEVAHYEHNIINVDTYMTSVAMNIHTGSYDLCFDCLKVVLKGLKK
jgi:hypothetical protein